MKTLASLFLISALTACGGGGSGDDDTSGATCGNNVKEAGESCDDGNTMAGDGCSATCVVEATPTAYRVTTITLADPHPFAAGVLDVTGQVNTQLSDGITMDGSMPADGKLDLSIVPVFRPLAQASGAMTPLDIVFADCTAPLASTMCTRPTMGTVVSTTATNAAGTCLEPVAGTTGGYTPAVVTPTAPCFASAAASFDVALGSIVLPLEEARIGATYTGDPATGLTSGLIMGFVTKEDADKIILPMDILVVGGMPLSAILKASDQDTGPGGATGWWFYLNFAADPVAYTD